MERPMSKMTIEPPKKVNHKRNIKLLNTIHFVRNISNKERGKPLERGEPPKMTPSLDEPSLIVTTNLKIKSAYAQCNITNVLKCAQN